MPLTERALKSYDLSDNRKKIDNESCKNEHRVNREHLKRYLSSQIIEMPLKKTFELTESNVHVPATSRILQQFINLGDQKNIRKEKSLDRLIALKIANKSVLNAISRLNLRKDDAKKIPELIMVPEELKSLDQEMVSGRSEVSKMLEWFEKAYNEEIDPFMDMGSLKILDIVEQKKAMENAENILNLSINKLTELVNLQCSEKAMMINKLFSGFKKFWEVSNSLKNYKQENQIRQLTNDLDNYKSNFISLTRSSTEKLFTVKFIQIKKTLESLKCENKLKDVEIERLNRNIQGLKSERANKLKKELETYEKMINKIKRKVSFIDVDKAPKIRENFNNKFRDSLLSELHLVDQFKDNHLNEDKIEEIMIETENEGESYESEIEQKSEKYASVSTETNTMMEDKATFIGFVYFNAAVQTDYLDIRCLTLCENDDKLNEDMEYELIALKHEGLIPIDADINSWSAGYYTGLERGKAMAMKEFVNEEETIDKTENHTEESIGDEQSPKIFEEKKDEQDLEKREDVKKRKHQTKIKEFNFQKREKVVVQKITKSKKIREEVVKISEENMNKRTKMSKKMIMKTINTIYASLLTKYKQDDNVEDLLEFIYLEFESKYSMKKVIDRKIIDFLSNAIMYSDVLKIKNFLKFLDLAEKINQPSWIYKKDSLLLYLTGHESIFKSKAGIMPQFDDTSEYHFIPLVRAIEYYKEKFFEVFPAQRYSKCSEFLEKNSVFDKKRLNKSGIVDLEQILTFAMIQYEEHTVCVKNTADMIFKAVTCDNSPIYIRKSDLLYISTLLKNVKYSKDVEAINHELIKIEDIMNSNIREIFPEDFTDIKEIPSSEHEIKKIEDSLKQSKTFEKNRYLELFKNQGKSVEPKVLPYIKKIIEIQRKASLHAQ